MPGGISKVRIELFENKTAEPYLSTCITEAVTYRLMRMHDVSLVESIDNAEAVLSGFVKNYRIKAASYGVADNIKSYRVAMTIDATLRQVADGRILWQGEVSHDFDFVSSTASLTEQEGLERETQQQLCRRLAEDLSWQMTENFGEDMP